MISRTNIHALNRIAARFAQSFAAFDISRLLLVGQTGEHDRRFHAAHDRFALRRYQTNAAVNVVPAPRQQIQTFRHFVVGFGFGQNAAPARDDRIRPQNERAVRRNFFRFGFRHAFGVKSGQFVL